MAKIVCRYCGQVEETSDFIPETKRALERNKCCFTCHHWKKQYDLDLNERGRHGFAIINSTHYVLCPHTDVEIFKGCGGREFRIKFNDGHEAFCDNLWCQGYIPEGHWRELMPDNASFIIS